MKRIEASTERPGAPTGRAPVGVPLHIVALLLLAIGLFGAVPEARADAWKNFKEARDLVEEGGDLEKAEKLLRQAIAEDPTSNGNVFRRYVPHYYLGWVLAERGACREALSSFQAAMRNGALKDEWIADLRQREARCEKVVDEVAQARSRAEAETAEARQALAKVEKLARQAILEPLWSDGSPSFQDRQARASRQVDGFDGRMRQADVALDANGLRTVEREAREVKGQLETLAADANARMAEVDSAMGEASKRLTEAERQAQRSLRSVRDLDPLPPGLAGAASAVRRALSQADQRAEGADVATLDRLADELEKATARLRPLAAGPPEALLTAAEAYLAGDYQAVLDGLAEETFGEDRTRYHALLLQAASVHGLWVGLGRQSADLDQRLEELLAEAVAIAPSPGQPAERFYPPSFRALYDRAVAAAAEEAAAEGAAAEGAAAEGAAEAAPGGDASPSP